MCGFNYLKFYHLVVIIFIVFIFTACAVQKEKPRLAIKKEEILEEQKKIKKPEALHCKEDTHSNFNITGILPLPFIKVVLSDLDGDGLTDVIAGGKYGKLYLYRNSGDL